MAGLNIVSTGSYDPYVKYNAKAGRWYAQINGAEVEVQNPVFVADFEKIKTGWLFFKEGNAPERVWDADLAHPADKPARTYVDSKGNTRDCFKRGFSLRLFSKSAFNGVVELSANSMHLCKAISDLYSQYDAGKAANPGKAPVVAYIGSTPVKDKEGTNYAPNFQIQKWVDVPAELRAAPAAPVQQAPAAAAPAPVQHPAAAAVQPVPVTQVVNGGAVSEF